MYVLRWLERVSFRFAWDKPEITFIQFEMGEGNSDHMNEFAILNSPAKTILLA
jgi:hypothetical protein